MNFSATYVGVNPPKSIMRIKWSSALHGWAAFQGNSVFDDFGINVNNGIQNLSIGTKIDMGLVSSNYAFGVWFATYSATNAPITVDTVGGPVCFTPGSQITLGIVSTSPVITFVSN